MMTITTILAFLGAGAASIGPLALAGGPLGIAIAWLGSAFGGRSVRLIAIGAGIVLLIVATAAVTIHVQHLERDRAAYRTLSAGVASLPAYYGCGNRPLHERDLGACLTAIARDNAAVQAAEIERQRRAAAIEQAAQDAAETAARHRQQAEDAAIDGDAGHDGAVPQVLLDAWARERAARGVK